jgi:benzoyl-CoA reductase subunit C
MERFRVFYDVISDPARYAREWKEKNNRPVIGTLCSYAPEEIILASGALGYRVFGSGADISKADAHIQSYACSLVRGAMEDSLSGGLDFLDGIVFPHTCDSIQRLSDIWRMNVKKGFHLDLVMPVKLNSESSREYMSAVIRRFKQDLELNINHEITDADLEKAISTCNQIREVMQKLYATRQQSPHSIKGEDMHALVKAGMMMDRDHFLSLTREIADELDVQQSPETTASKRIVLSGGLCNMPDVYGVIEKAGATVVADDLCTGSRFFEGSIEGNGDLLDKIARRYSDRNVCPAKHAGIRNRGENLVKVAKESKADGVLYIFLKFCDPHGFDYPYLKEMLEENGIPCLLYEMEEQLLGGGQFETRCQAFIEML